MATSNPQIQIEVAVDASGVTEGVNQAKRDIASLPQALQAEAQKTAAAFEKINEAAKKNGSTFEQELRKQKDLSAQQRKEIEELARQYEKAEKTQRTFSAQLQRNQNEFIKQTQGQEALAKSLGVTDAAVLAQARAFDAQRAALQRGGRELDKFGNTAKQTAAALRQVPAQFTDIVVSLQGGQAPLTVLLQQGGQLKDIFGSAGAAAQALGGYILGLVNPFTVAAAAAGGLFLAYRAGASELEAFNKTLILNGNAAGLTGQKLGEVAQSVSKLSSNITQSNAAEFLNVLAGSAKVGADNLVRFTQAALEFERAGGGAAEEVAKAFTELAESPAKAVLKLNDSMNFLTRATFEQIKALEQQGKFTDAARVAQEAYATAIEERTPQLVGNLGLVERAWLAIKTAGAGALDAIKNIGRGTELDKIDAQLQNAINTGATQSEIRALEVRRNRLAQIAEVEQQAAQAKAETNKQVKAGIELSQQAEQVDSKLFNQRQKIAEATATFAKATQGLAKDSAAYAEAERNYLAIVSNIAKVEETRTRQVRGRTEAQREAEEARKRDLEVVKTRNELVERSYKDQIKFEQDLAKSIAATVTEREKETARVQDQVQRELDVAAAIGLTKEQVAELAAAKYDDVAAGLERQAIDEELLGYSARLVEETRKQAKAFRELAEAKRTTGRKQAEFDADKEATKQAEAATKDWLKAAADIEKSITDALFRAFESGKGFVQALRDTIVNAFKTMVLRPIVQGVVQSGLGALGFSGPAGASGGSGLLGDAAGAASLYNQLSTGTGLIGSVLASNAAYGAAIGTTSIGAGSQAAMLAAQTGQFGAAGVAATSQAAAGAGAGASSTLAAIPGWGWALAGLALLAGSGIGKTPGEQTMGGYASTRGREATLENAMLVTGGGGWDDGAWARDLITREDSGLKAFTQTTVDGVLEAANNRAKSLGLNIALGIDAGFAANLNGQGTDKNAFGYAQVFANDKLVAEFQDRELGPDLVKAGAAFTRKLQDAVAEALLEGSGIESKEFVQFDQTTGQFTSRVETAGQTLDRLANSLTSVNTAFDALGLSLFDASLNGADAASTFVDLVGGLDQFQNLTRSYYENFYTEGERAAFAMRQISAEFAALGQTLPGTREEFRALVESARAAGDNNLLANLLKLAPAFASVNASVTNLLTGLQNAANQFNLQAGNTTQLALAQAQQAAAFSALVTQLPGIVENGFTETQIQQYLVNAQNSGEFQAILGEAGIALATNYLNAVNNVNALRNAGTGSTTTPDFTFDSGISDAAELARQKWQAAFDALSRAVDVQRELAQQQLEDATAVYELSRESARALRGEVEATRQQTAREGLRFIDQALTTLRTTGYLPEEQGLREAIEAARGGMDSRAYTSAFEQDRDRLVLAGKLQQLADLAEPQKTAAEQQLEYLDTLVETAQSQLDALLGNNTAILTLTEAVTKWQQAIAGTTVGSPSTGANAVLSDFIAKWTEALDLKTRPFFASAEVQGFASGGYHSGGIRIVGERGPELEVTGPARIYSAEQTKEMLGGGTELINEVRALREDNMAQSRSIAQLQTRVARVLERWDGNGLPQERVEV